MIKGRSIQQFGDSELFFVTSIGEELKLVDPVRKKIIKERIRPIRGLYGEYSNYREVRDRVGYTKGMTKIIVNYIYIYTILNYYCMLYIYSNIYIYIYN